MKKVCIEVSIETRDDERFCGTTCRFLLRGYCLIFNTPLRTQYNEDGFELHYRCDQCLQSEVKDNLEAVDNKKDE